MISGVLEKVLVFFLSSESLGVMTICSEPSVHKYMIYGFKVHLQTYLQVCYFPLFR